MYSTSTFCYSSLWLINLTATEDGYKKVLQVWLCSLNHFFCLVFFCGFFLRESQTIKNNNIKKYKEYGNESW